MRLHWVTTVAVVALASLVAPAQQMPSDVAFGGEHFFRFRATVGGLTPEERAAALQERFTQVFLRLLTHRQPLIVSVRTQGAVRVIVVSGVPFATVTPADAAANHMTVKQLARVWQQNLENGLWAILSL